MQPCPSVDQLRQLLAEQLSEQEGAPLTAHLEVCDRCQQLLEQLTNCRGAALVSDASPPASRTVLSEEVRAFLDRLKASDPARTVKSEKAGSRQPAEPDAEPGPGLPAVPGYELLKLLGQGGTGRVYKARDQRLNRFVALKLFATFLPSEAKQRARIHTEAEAAARLQHPNIVQIYEIGENAGQPYLVLELIHGPTLGQCLDSGPLPPVEAAGLLQTLAHAVQHAHERGIVHRDLKPANILLQMADGQWPIEKPRGRSSGQSAIRPLLSAIPKITDFGLAKQMDEQLGPTGTGVIMGTPAYMSPEQASGRTREIGPATDIYALGVILYEALTGRPPFQGATVVETLEQIRYEEPVPPARLRPGIPTDLQTITLKCLQKEPWRRYERALDLAEDLRRFLAQEPIRARPPSLWYQGVKFVRRNKGLVSGAVGILLSILVGAVVAVFFAIGEAQQRRLAEANAHRADAKTVEAQANLYQAQAHLYAARMNLVQAAWQDAHLRRVFDLLELCRPAEPGDRDLRGWEWHHQWRLCHDELRTFAGHTSWVLSVAFSPDGRRLASASHDRTIHVWDVATGQTLHVLRGHGEEIASVAFSPDGTRLASASGDRTIKVWDAADGRELRTLKGHTDHISAVAFSPDGRWLASASWDKSVRIWDAATGREQQLLQGHSEEVRGVAFSPDGRWLASGSSDHTVRLWDVARPQEVHCLRGHGEDVEGVAFSPDGRWLASTSWDRTVRLWDVATGRERHTLRGHTNWVYQAAFSPDGQLLASAGWDETVRMWDVASGQLLRTIRGHTSRVHSVAFSSDGFWLASASADSTVKLWEAAGGEEFRAFRGQTASVEALAFSRDGQRLASVSGTEVKVWDPASGIVLATLHGHDGPVHGIAFHPDATRLASASTDRTVRLWDVATGRELRILRGHEGPVYTVAFSPDGERLASAGEDGVVRVWDPESGQELASLKGHTRKIGAVVFSPDGRWLASGGPGADGGGEIRLWDASDGHELRTLHAPLKDFLALAVSPDGRWLATATGEFEQRGEIQLWEVADGRLVRTLRGHSHWIWSLAFNPDGTRLASAGYDHVVKLWDPATGQELRSLQGRRRFLSVAFSPDGTRLAAGCDENPITRDFTLKLWDARPPTPELNSEREALAMLDFLFARPLRRADVREYLRGPAALSPAARERALALVERYPEETDPERFYQANWAVLCRPRLNAVHYQFALYQAEAACRLCPGQALYHTALGAAQYRTGHYEEARTTLSQASALTPAGLAFLAMAQERLGQHEQARATLARLPELDAKRDQEKDEEAETLRREAEALLAGTAG